MEELKRLDSSNVPVLKSVWVHAGDVVGINQNGEPVILARLEGGDGVGIIREKKTRPPRKKKEQTDLPASKAGNLLE